MNSTLRGKLQSYGRSRKEKPHCVACTWGVVDFGGPFNFKYYVPQLHGSFPIVAFFLLRLSHPTLSTRLEQINWIAKTIAFTSKRDYLAL